MGGYAGLGAPNPNEHDIETYETTLSGDLNGDDEPGLINNDDNSHHVVTCSACDGTATLDGFTITGGNAEQPPLSDCCSEHPYPGCDDPSCESVVCSYLSFCCSVEWDFVCASLALAFCDACVVTGEGEGGGMYNDEGSPTVTSCTFRENVAPRGGAMYTSGGSPTITKCKFNGNKAYDSGGAIYSQDSSPTIIDCNFTGNTTDFDSGGGIYCQDSDPTIIECKFTANTADGDGGGLSGCDGMISSCTISGNTAHRGGGLYQCDGTINECIISANTADGDGGGLFDCDGTIVNCAISGNTSAGGGGGLNGCDGTISKCTISGNTAVGWGGGLDGCDGTTINCRVAGNEAGVRGGGFYTCDGAIKNCTITLNSAGVYGAGLWGCDGLISGCTITGNMAGANGGGFYLRGSATVVHLTNSILWDNSAPSGAEIALFTHPSTGQPSTLSVSYCDVAGEQAAVYVDPDSELIWGDGNLDSPPVFVDPDNDDYHLSADSPCIDTGDPDYVPGTGETDLDSHARILCNRVDMGAYEFGVGDFDCDHDLDLDDFASWAACMTGPYLGPYGAGCEAFDFEFDADVDMRDFAEFQEVFIGSSS
jgi:predicted outer membrane repeat protein